jgi:MFS family permease
MSSRSKLPSTVYLLGLTIFSLVTAEFMVAGMMPALAEAFSVSLAQVGNLIAFYALGMAVGGPLVTLLLLSKGISNKSSLIGLLVCYVFAGALAAAAQSYLVLALARIVMGVASAVCIGLCMTVCAGLVAPERRGKAVSVVLAGLMLSPVVGVPLTTWIQQHQGWRASAWLVVVLALLCTVLVARQLAPSANGSEPPLRRQWADLQNKPLWAAYLTSGLIIGATFAAFSYCTPILIHEVGGRPRLRGAIAGVVRRRQPAGQWHRRPSGRSIHAASGRLGPAGHGAGLVGLRPGRRSPLVESDLLHRPRVDRGRPEPGDGRTGDESGRARGAGEYYAYLGDYRRAGFWQLGRGGGYRSGVRLAITAVGRRGDGIAGTPERCAADRDTPVGRGLWLIPLLMWLGSLRNASQLGDAALKTGGAA